MFVNEQNFSKLTHLAMKNILDLPASEIKYYLYILLSSISEKNDELNRSFLNELIELIKVLHQLSFLRSPDSIDEEAQTTDLLIQITNHCAELKRLANTHGFSAQIKTLLLNIEGIIAGTVASVVGGFLGAIAGFARGILYNKPILGFFSGSFAGSMIGAMMGFRAPKKLFKDPMLRQIKFGLDGVDFCLENTKEEYMAPSFFDKNTHPFSFYLEEINREIKALFNNDEAYQAFLEQPITYEIGSFLASFIGVSLLHGCVGQHAYIKININDSERVIHFSPETLDTSERPAQSETRTATGQKIIEMLAYHRKLQETNAPSPSFILTKLKPGDNDCFSYVNKVLLGTSQEGTTLRRFANMSWLGQLAGAGIESLSPFKPDFFSRKIDQDPLEGSLFQLSS